MVQAPPVLCDQLLHECLGAKDGVPTPSGVLLLLPVQQVEKDQEVQVSVHLGKERRERGFGAAESCSAGQARGDLLGGGAVYLHVGRANNSLKRDKKK